MVRRSAQAIAILVCATSAAALAARSVPSAADEGDRGTLTFANDAGLSRTVDVTGTVDFGNPFFASLGTNGRACVTCHQPDAAWTITPANLEARFERTRGLDPVFSSNDGSNCESAAASSMDDRRAASSLLLTRGLIRVGLDVPPGADFVVESVADPFQCAPGSSAVSAYRRPLPATNLPFISAVMWDCRESAPTTTIDQDLLHQANDATRGHAQAAMDITPQQAREIVDFETGLFTAQIRDQRAGSLHGEGASGGPAALSQQPFFLGINDPIGLNPSGAAFDSRVFTLFGPWLTLRGNDPVADARRSIARGAEIFNAKAFTLSGVGGLNGVTFSNGASLPASFTGTCTICHDTPNAGNHSVKAPLDIGLTDPAIAPYLPVYTLRNLATGDSVRTTDPGRALISGKWADVGKFKGPVLRALAARAPYFHNGAARSLDEVVDFYDTRFHIGLTRAEKADLVAFLNAL